MTKKILEKIKSRGYWQVNFRPTVFTKERIPALVQCREVIEKAVVQLRGWDYPHYPTHNDEKEEIYNCHDYIEAWIDWEDFKELWRMYQSGQYIHFFGMSEDWYNEDSLHDDLRKSIEPGSILEVIQIIYRVTEIYEFLARLIKQGMYKEGVIVEIILSKTNDRKLAILDPGRIPLHDDYVAKIPNIIFKKEYTEKEVIGKAKDLAFEVILYIFERFNWNNPPKEVIKNDQTTLLERRF